MALACPKAGSYDEKPPGAKTVPRHASAPNGVMSSTLSSYTVARDRIARGQREESRETLPTRVKCRAHILPHIRG